MHIRKAYEDQGLRHRLPVFDQGAWQQMVSGDPSIPRCKDDLHAAVEKLKKPALAILRPRYRDQYVPRPEILDDSGGATRATEDVRTVQPDEESALLCRNHEVAMLNLGLGNPELSAADRDEVVHDLDGDTPVFEGVRDTEHFTIRWTQQSAEPLNNLADAAIVDRAASVLESAYSLFNAAFSRAPYTVDPSDKIGVVFQHVPEGAARADPPDGPLLFNATTWATNPDAIEPTAAHELFHKLQYTYGYRERYLPSVGDSWFFEGTAGLAEILVCDCVSMNSKITTVFDSPRIALRSLSYSSLPFWLFGCDHCEPPVGAVRALLESFENSGQPKTALSDFVNFVHEQGNLPANTYEFFLEFCQARLAGSLWRSSFRDAHKNPIGAEVIPDGRFDMKRGAICSPSRSVSDLACHHYVLDRNINSGVSKLKIIVGAPTRDVLGRVICQNGANVVGVIPIDSHELLCDVQQATKAVIMLASASPQSYYELSVQGE